VKLYFVIHFTISSEFTLLQHLLYAVIVTEQIKLI